jgi:hypothetical protein
MSSHPKFHVLAAQGCDLAIAKPRLNSDQQQRSVPLADPRFRVGRCHKSHGFLLSQERHRGAIITLRRYGQNALAVQRQCGFADRYVSEEGVQGRQPIVARSGAVAACELKMLQELPHEGRIDIFGPKLGWRTSKML